MRQKKENEKAIIIFSKEITGTTTPVVKTSDFIGWENVEHIQHNMEKLELTLKNPEKYCARMKYFFVEDTFLIALKGFIKISFVETNASYEGFSKTLETYTNRKYQFQ